MYPTLIHIPTITFCTNNHWKNAPFSTLQVLPTGAKAVTSWINPDEPYEDIVGRLDEVVKELQDLRVAEEWFQKGLALRDVQRYEQAIVTFDQAIRLNPNFAPAYHNKGFALNELMRYEEALVTCDQAIRLDPNYALAYNNKGVALNNLKRYDETNKAFAKAKQLGYTE
jgi:tetratricopeptide (TPR) repeat protein